MDPEHANEKSRVSRVLNMQKPGCVCYRLAGTVAGDYRLSVTNSQGDTLKGSPFAIPLQASLISATHSSLELLHETSIVAGSEAQLKLAAFDQYGNQVRR